MADAPARSDTALDDWIAQQPESVTSDPIWRLNCFREALFLIELARADAQRFERAGADRESRGQLLRAVASIAANLAEGYGRPTAKDRVRFLSYAFGSARESMTWYRLLRDADDEPLFFDRLDRLARVSRMLVGLQKRMRPQTDRKFDAW
jgi:four helix bundle protein